jgi:hypothetical protein
MDKPFRSFISTPSKTKIKGSCMGPIDGIVPFKLVIPEVRSNIPYIKHQCLSLQKWDWGGSCQTVANPDKAEWETSKAVKLFKEARQLTWWGRSD